MVWLIVGVCLWSVAHLGKSAGRPVRSRVIERIGEEPFKGIVAVSVLASVVLIVIGWRATPAEAVYAPSIWGYRAALVLMFLSIFLFAASTSPNVVARLLRHPQLTAVATWSLTHLLANGDKRSLVLFGGVGVWAIVTIVSINLRDGAWKRPDPQPASSALKPLIGAAVGCGLLWLVHPWLFGVGVKVP